jgi:hypothetical protein
MVNKILFLVGKGSDTYPIKYTSKKAPDWLKQGSKTFFEFVNDDDHTVPSDVAMAMYLDYKYPRSIIDCMLGTEAISKKVLDPYDLIVVIFDPIEVFHCGGRDKTCPLLVKKMERALRTTSAFVIPYPDFHKYIIVKPSYYKDLKRANIPVAPFIKISPDAALKDINGLKDRIIKKNWKGVIVKPSYAGYSLGIKVYKNIERTKSNTLQTQFEKLKQYGFPSVTLQEFVPTFGNHFEIRTYWVNGKYAYSVGTLTKTLSTSGGGLPIDDEDTFVSEGGNIPDSLKRKLKVLGKEVLKALPIYPYPHPLLRIDFGCCISTDSDCVENYFVNEVETMACNLLPEETKYPIVEKLANVIYHFATKVKGTKEPPLIHSTYLYKSQKCIKPV